MRSWVVGLSTNWLERGESKVMDDSGWGPIVATGLQLALVAVGVATWFMPNRGNRHPFRVGLWRTGWVEAVGLAGCVLLGVYGPGGLGFLPAIIVFALLYCLRPERHPNFLGNTDIGWSEMVLGATRLFLSHWPLLLFMGWVSRQLLQDESPQPAVEELVSASSEPLALARALAFVLIIAPLVEETIFRGILYRVMKRPLGIGPAIVTSGLLFAAIHRGEGFFPHWPSFFPLFLLGVLLALSYERTGDLRTPIFYHCIFNAFSASMILLSHVA